jgi:hypothetical protein
MPGSACLDGSNPKALRPSATVRATELLHAWRFLT